MKVLKELAVILHCNHYSSHLYFSFFPTLLKQQRLVAAGDIIPQSYLHKKQQGAFPAIWVSAELFAYF